MPIKKSRRTSLPQKSSTPLKAFVVNENFLRQQCSTKVCRPTFKRLESTLHVAVKNNLKGLLQDLIKRDRNVNILDKDGRSPLHIAALKGNLEILEILLKNNANPNIQDCVGNTALHATCSSKFGTREVIDMLLNYGAHINYKNSRGETPLFAACFSEHIDLVKVLLQRGADVNCKDKGRSPMQEGVKCENLKIVELFVRQNDLKIDYQDDQGNTALFYACENGGNFELVDLLITHGANCKIKNLKQETPLHWVMESKSEFTYPDITDILLENGAEVNSENEDKKTPLHIATANCCGDIIASLLRAGASMKVRDKYGNTPAHYLANENYEEVLLMLVLFNAGRSKDEDIFTIKNNDGKTPINLMKPDQIDAFSIYINEITKMKQLKLKNSFSLHDFMLTDSENLHLYIENEIIKELYEQKMFLIQFPCYGNILIIKYQIGLLKKEKLLKSTSALTVLTRFTLPKDVLQYIVNFLDDSDLDTLASIL